MLLQMHKQAEKCGATLQDGKSELDNLDFVATECTGSCTV